MALNDITFNRGQGGLGRPLPGSDHISGFIMPFVNASLPAGFLTTDRIKKVSSIAEAEALSIVSGGAAGIGTLWYHVNEFFRIQPKGVLYISLIDSLAITYSTDVETLQNFANGDIRQIGFYDGGTTFSAANTTTIQTGCTNSAAVHKPVSVLYTADFQAVSDLTTLADLRALTNENVSVVLGEDGTQVGAALAVSVGQSITFLGAALGAVSLSKVHENIGWVQKFNFVDNLEFDEPAFANSAAAVLVKNTLATTVTLLDTNGYIFLRKHVGIAGSYANDSHTATAVTGDYAYIENQRTIDKAVRVVRTALLPNLGSPLYVNADGTLTEETIQIFTTDADRPLDTMLTDGEISAKLVTINPAQDVLATSEIVIALTLVPVGTARQITVNIGFAVSITA